MKSLFASLGASEKETQAFMALLPLGAQPVSVLAKHLNLPRSSTYVIIERLKKLQLIEEFERHGIIYVKCIPVRQLEDLLNARQSTIKQTLQLLQEQLPELEKLENKLSITPTVRFYEGKHAVMKLYEEVIRENEFYAYFDPPAVRVIMPEYYFKVGDMLKKNKGRARELLVSCPEALEYKKRFESPSHQIKILPKDSVFHADMIICKDTFYLISYGDSEISGTGVQNTSLAQAQRAIFDELWSRI